MTIPRKHPRVRTAIGVEVAVDDSPIVATTRDLSIGGAALIVPSPLEEGETVQVTLVLMHDGIADADEPPVTADASVVWTAETDDGLCVAGVEFRGMSSATAARLRRYLAYAGATRD